MQIYYSTITPFYHIWSSERAKYETVIHCSVTKQIRKERELFNERSCFQHHAKPENLAYHPLSLVISHISSNKGHVAGFLCFFTSFAPGRTEDGFFLKDLFL